MAIQNSINVGVVAGGGFTYTFPSLTDTLITKTSTDILTNKTLTSPILGGTPVLDATSSIPFYIGNIARQAIINGNFDIWERLKYASFSVTGLSTAGYAADKWKWDFVLDGGTDPTLTQSRQILTSGDILNSYYYYRIAPNGTGTSYGVNSAHILHQNIEYGVRYLCGLNKTITVSFYARASVAGKRLGLYLIQNYGTGGAPTSAEDITGTNWTLTSSWVKYTYTFTTNTIIGKTFGTSDNDNLQVNFVLQWSTGTYGSKVGAVTAETFGGNGTIDIAQVQVNSGSISLPFQPYDLQTEKNKCHRYCFVPDTSANNANIGYGNAYNTGGLTMQIKFPVTMRIVPTISPALTAGDWSVTDQINTYACISMVLSAVTSREIGAFDTGVSGTPLTAFRFYSLIAPTAGKTIVFNADL